MTRSRRSVLLISLICQIMKSWKVGCVVLQSFEIFVLIIHVFGIVVYLMHHK